MLPGAPAGRTAAAGAFAVVGCVVRVAATVGAGAGNRLESDAEAMTGATLLAAGAIAAALAVPASDPSGAERLGGTAAPWDASSSSESAWRA